MLWSIFCCVLLFALCFCVENQISYAGFRPNGRLAASVVPTLAQLAQLANARLYEGAVATEGAVKRFDDAQRNNPGVLAVAAEQLAQLPSVAESDGTARNAHSAGAWDQLNALTDDLKRQVESANAPPKRPGQPNDISQQLTSLIGSGLHALKKNQQEVEQAPGAFDVMLRDPEFQQRMALLAEQVLSTEDAHLRLDTKANEGGIETLTLGPLVRTSQAEDRTPVSPPMDFAKPNTGAIASDCWFDDTHLEGPVLWSGEQPNAVACYEMCHMQDGCKLFSYDALGHACKLFENVTGMGKSISTVSGPMECTEATKAQTPSSPPETARDAATDAERTAVEQGLAESQRRLGALGLTASDYDKLPEDCLATETQIQGKQFLHVDNIPSPSDCQVACLNQGSCEFFSYVAELRRCYMYNEAFGVLDAMGVISGPRACIESADARNIQDHAATGGIVGQLVAPGQEQPYIDSPRPSEAQLDEGTLAGQAAETVSSNPGGGLLSGITGGGGLFGNVLGGAGLLGGGGLLGNLFDSVAGELSGQSVEEVGTLQGMASTASSMFSTFQAIMAAGDTVMNTFPIADAVRTGYQLANSGILGGGRKAANGASAPPIGVANPDVTCLSEGMRCCVPRDAAPKYQTNAPKLNGIDNARCTATYASVSDQLCVTTKYENDECGTLILETQTMYVYRNIMEMPNRNMNNAICECSIQKTVGENGERSIQSSGKWEYSLAAQEEKVETRIRNDEAAAKLANAAKVALAWGDVLTGSDSSTSGSGSATSFLNSLVSLVEEIREVDSGTASVSNSDPKTADTFINAAGTLRDALSQFGTSQTRRRLAEQTQNRVQVISGSGKKFPPVPLSCSVWRRECEDNPEGSLFFERCTAIRVVEDGCTRDDVTLRMNDDGQGDIEYVFGLPSTLGKGDLRMACEFVSLEVSEDGSVPSLCSSGVSFPIPTVEPDASTIFRGRSPLLEEFLTMVPKDAIVRYVHTMADATADSAGRVADPETPVMTFNTRGSTRRLREGVEVRLRLQPPPAPMAGLKLLAVFDVPVSNGHGAGVLQRVSVPAWTTAVA